MTEFRIEFSIQREGPGDRDFVEIGFGSSGAWSDVDQAAHMLQSAVEHREWEITPGMPEPSEIQ